MNCRNCSKKDIVDAIITAAVRRGNDGRGKGGLDGLMFTLACTDRESFGILLVAALRLRMKTAPEHRAAERILTEEERKEKFKAQLRERGLPEQLFNYIYDPNRPRAEPSTDARPNGTRNLMEATINAAIRHGSDRHGKDGLLGYMLVLQRTTSKTFVRLMALQWQVKAMAQSEKPQMIYEEVIAGFLARGIDIEAVFKEIRGEPEPLWPGEDPDPWGLAHV
jgi:hypothetical protein